MRDLGDGFKTFILRFGAFSNVLLSFPIIAVVMYFLIVRSMNVLPGRVAPKTEAAKPAICPKCLRERSPDANRCPNCTTKRRGSHAVVS